jgi:hypothetical protein
VVASGHGSWIHGPRAFSSTNADPIQIRVRKPPYSTPAHCTEASFSISSAASRVFLVLGFSIRTEHLPSCILTKMLCIVSSCDSFCLVLSKFLPDQLSVRSTSFITYVMHHALCLSDLHTDDISSQPLTAHMDHQRSAANIRQPVSDALRVLGPRSFSLSDVLTANPRTQKKARCGEIS